VTSDSINAFTWSDGISEGGSAIIDYRITYDQGIDNWVVLVSNIVPKSYQTTITLTPDTTYKYKVEARNSVGFSVLSDELTLLTAQIPD
jgi:hypothetical protein